MQHYSVLGINKDATLDDIKKAHRKLVFQCHPDRNPGDKEAEEKFKAVQIAYEVLSDSSKRANYDRLGYTGRRPSSPPPPPKPEPPKKKPKTKEDFERERAERDQQKNPTPAFLDKIKCEFFGSSNSGRNIMFQLPLTQSEKDHGVSKNIIIKKRDLCKRCIGDGKAMQQCPTCKNEKYVVLGCRTCDGYGAVEGTCSVCNGDGVKDWIAKDIRIIVPPRVQSGHVINVIGEGEDAPRKRPGDLRVIVV